MEPLPFIDDWSFIWKASLYRHADRLRYESDIPGVQCLDMAEQRLRFARLTSDKEQCATALTVANWRDTP